MRLMIDDGSKNMNALMLNTYAICFLKFNLSLFLYHYFVHHIILSIKLLFKASSIWGFYSQLSESI